MFCPNYKNKEIFDGFNEIVKALGGQPLTEEEFRSSELRNKRTGLNYSAMESAYTVYHRNGGNFLDLTPDGKHSILFDTLLEYFNGDRLAAIKAKSNVYSDEFLNWFGDWGRFKTADTKNNLFTPTGEVNWNYFEQLLDSYHNNQPDSMFSHGRYTLATRPENHFTGEKNTLNHIKFVTQSMLNLLEGKYDMDLPFVSEARASLQNQKDLMIIAAMFHDAAKPYRHGDIHGWESADILRDLLGIDYDNRVAEWAVRHHMPMPFSHKAEFSLSNPEAIEVAKNIARDARRIGIDANTAINAFVLINAADVINGRELDVDDNWAKKAGEEGLKKYNGDISVKNVLSIELKEKVALLKKAFDEIKDEDFGDTAYNYSHQERFNYQAFPEGGREDKKLPYLNNTEYAGVSKVIDENGEPLVVYSGHFEYTKPGKNPFKANRKAIQASINKEDAEKYGLVDAVYLNIRDDYGNYVKFDNISQFVKQYDALYLVDSDEFEDVNRAKLAGVTLPQSIGIINARKYYPDSFSDFVVTSSKQIKHVENLGTFNPDDRNIYNAKITKHIEDVNKKFGLLDQFSASSGESVFGINGFERLVQGEAVSSSEILSHVINTKLLSPSNKVFAEIIQHHDIPVRLGELEDDTIASIYYDNQGQMFITVNSNLIGNVSNRLFADSILHEVIHAVTINAIDNPSTEVESKFARQNKKVFDIFSKALPESEYDRSRVDEGFYILYDEKEFAAVFASDPNARSFIYDAADLLDGQKYGTFKRILARFVNSFVNLFTDKIAINTNRAQLDKYKRDLTKQLQNSPQILQGNIKSKDIFDSIYNNSSSIIIRNDHIYRTMHDAALMYRGFQRSNSKIKPYVTTETIARSLFTRRKIIENSSASKDTILKISQMLETQGEQLLSDAMIDKYTGIISIINQLIPQVQSDYLYVKGLKALTADEYEEIVHNNFESYNKLAEDLQELMNQDSFKNDLVYALGISDNQEKVTRFFQGEYNDLLDQLSKVTSLYNKLKPKLQQLRETTVAGVFGEISEAVHDPDAEKWLENLNRTEEDISNFVVRWGAMDSATDSGIRAIYRMVEKANKSADIETYDLCNDLLELASKVKRKDLKKLYETLDDGTTSGYLIRDLNFGKFYAAYDEAIKNINKTINEKYNLKLAEDNRLPPNEEEARKEWNSLRNDWLSKNCHRKFKNEYYEALGNLPEIARKRLSEINNLIFQINMLPGVISEKDFGDKYPHYEVLDKETYEKLENLRTQKKELYSFYYDNGKRKTGEDLYIAEQLAIYHDTLYGGKDGKKIHFQKDRKAWLTALKKELLICGGQEALNVFGNEDFESLEEYIKESSTFNKSRWNTWNERNSKFQFISNGIEDEKGREGTLINDQIMREFGDDKPYYGPEEQAIADQIADLMRPYYKSNGFVNDKKMSRSLKKELIELMLKQTKIRREITSKNPALKKKSERYGAIIKKYLKFEETEAFKEIEDQVKNRIIELYGYFDADVFFRVMQQYGTAWFDRNLGIYTDFRPYKWYTKAIAKDKYKYMEWVPGENFTDIEGSTEFRNPNFKSEYGTSYVPLKEKYENKKFKEINGDLAKLHEKIAEILKSANQKMSNRVYVDNYLLPQITGSMYKRMKAHKRWGDKLHAAIDYILEQIGFGNVPQNEELQQYGAEYQDRGDDETGRSEMTLSEKRKKLGLLKNRPDGHPLHMIPQYYTEKKNPQYISQDIIGITLEYFNMAARFKNKSEIRGKCELIVDALENRTYSHLGEDIKGKDSNTYKAARKFLDMNLYDIRREKSDFAKKSNYDFLRTTQLLARYTTANNLGANPKVALTGFLTTMWSHLINAISGNGYSFHDAHDAGKEVLWFALKQACTFGARTIENRLSNDEVVVIAEYYNVANQLKRKYKNQNRNPFIDAVYRNSVFGLLSSVDFISKSCIALSVLHSFRFVDGEFISEDLIYRNAAKLPKEQRQSYLNKALKEYKNAPHLRQFIKVKDHKFTVTNHKESYDKVDYLVRSRIEKIAERADGMATAAQKAAITQSWVGALILIHRQYLPLMLQERFSDPVYDYDMEMYKNGQFKIFRDFLVATMRGSVLGGIGAGALGGFLIGNIFGAAAGAIAGGAYSMYSKNKHDSKSMKEVWKDFTDYTKSDEYQDTLKSIYNKRALKQVGSEIAIYNILLGPFIDALCKYADQPDQKNSKFLQFICLVARQFQWEAYNPYRFTDVFNTIKNVTAATGSGDVAQDVFKAVGAEANYALRLLLPRAGGTTNKVVEGLQNTIENPWLKKVKSGAYQGDTQIFKTGMKTIPWSNTMEQILDSKGKRKWIEGNTMGVKKDDEAWMYNIYKAFK